MEVNHIYMEIYIPYSWRNRLSKASTLSEVSDLFNEAENYSDFDCCAELEVWCKDHPANMAGLDKPICIFAETELEQLVYGNSERKWKVEKKQSRIND